MDNQKIILKEVTDLQKVNSQHSDVQSKLDELIALLDESSLDSESVKFMQQKFNTAVEAASISKQQVDEFKQIDELSETASREELLDQFSVLLTSSRIDSRLSTKFIRQERASSVVMFLIGTVMVALGFAMIVMPAPPYFEMFTIYYFSLDDGVTLMDLISLLIILAGVYFMVLSLFKNRARTR